MKDNMDAHPRDPAELLETVQLRKKLARLESDYSNLEARYRAVCDGDLPQVVLSQTKGHSGTGWYFWHDEYPDEGSSGAYEKCREAAESIQQIDCMVEMDSVIELARHCDDQDHMIQEMKKAIGKLVQASEVIEISSSPQSEALELAIRNAKRFIPEPV